MALECRRVALLDPHALAGRIAVSGHEDRGRGARDCDPAGGGEFIPPPWQRSIRLAQEVKSIERLDAGDIIRWLEDFVRGGGVRRVVDLLQRRTLPIEKSRGRPAEDDVFIRIVVVRRGKDAAGQDAAGVNRADVCRVVERKRHGERLRAGAYAVAQALRALARLRYSAIQAHVFDILDHAGLELEGIQTRGHAEESGVSFGYGLVVWHLLLL